VNVANSHAPNANTIPAMRISIGSSRLTTAITYERGAAESARPGKPFAFEKLE